MDFSPQPQSPTHRDPSTLFYQQDGIRRSVVTAYWIVIILAIPLWWSTTSIERLALPDSSIQQQAQRALELPVTICLETSDRTLEGKVVQGLLESKQADPNRWAGVMLSVKSANECVPLRDSYVVKHHNGAPYVHDRVLFFSMTGANDSGPLVDVLVSLLVPYTVPMDPDRRAAHYSSRYRLAFSLLNEDATSGGSVTGWKVRQGLRAHINPHLERLNHLHNFTIESQVQFHAPLAFSPLQIEETYAVSPEDLTVFVNSAEWTLSSSSSNDPVLHFILFIPSATRRPLHILTKEGAISPSNAFILPQWGGIVIHNPTSLTSDHELPSKDLDIVFNTFSRQLLGLLGVPRLPPTLEPKQNSQLSHWQIDALMRRRTLENAAGSRDTLLSIVKLVNQLDGMPVHEDVQGDVKDALSSLVKMYNSAHTSLYETFFSSVQSFNLASKAFSNPGMLALLYFPTEHKLGVYAPLFASAGAPLIVAAVRELKIWRANGAAKQKVL